MQLSSFNSRQGAGFSIVELMVGIVISMIAVFIIMQIFVQFEWAKRGAVGGANAQTSGAFGLLAVERDIRMAGYGLTAPGALGCKIRRFYDGAEIEPMTLAPVVVMHGTKGTPDGIRIIYSSKTGTVPARVIQPHPPQAANFFLNTSLGMTSGDMLIAYEAGKDCALFQLTKAEENGKILHVSGQSKWNAPGGSNIFPDDGYSTNAFILNLGSLVDLTYTIDSNYNLQISQYSSQTNESVVRALVPNIVTMRAQYGFDARAGIQADTQVTAWSDEMIDADRSGVAGDKGDIQRIYGLRLAVVARNESMEKPNADGNCDFYTRAVPALSMPTWMATNPENGNLELTEIDVSKNPDGTDNPRWECFRYKVFNTVIPLRNAIWGQQ